MTGHRECMSLHRKWTGQGLFINLLWLIVCNAFFLFFKISCFAFYVTKGQHPAIQGILGQDRLASGFTKDPTDKRNKNLQWVKKYPVQMNWNFRVCCDLHWKHTPSNMAVRSASFFLFHVFWTSVAGRKHIFKKPTLWLVCLLLCTLEQGDSLQ